MATPLPRISYPTHQIKIPTTGELLRFRPMLVHEHRMLMTAQETIKTLKGIEALKCLTDAVADVIASCLNVDKSVVYKFHSTDLTYSFMKIRSKSIGDVCEPVVLCPHCQTRNKLRVNLTQVEPQFQADWKPTLVIKMSDDVGIELRIPGMVEAFDKSITSSSEEGMSPEDTFKYIALAIKTIFIGEKVLPASDYSTADILKFVDDFSIDHLKDINKFLRSVPKISHRVNYTCVKPECGKPGFVLLENLRDFF